MKLWTILDQAQMDYIEKNGFLRADGRRVDPFLKPAYDWLVPQMVTKIGPQPANVKYPIWAYYHWDGEKRKRPDIRSLRHGYGDSELFRLELDIPDKRVVLTDYDEWHFVLSSGYIALNEEDDKIFDAKYEDTDCRYGNWPTYPESMKNEIRASWQRIFDLTSPRDASWRSPVHKSTIQATFWLLYKDDIKKVDKFTSKLTKWEIDLRN